VLLARNTIVVADPTPTRLSDWALKAGTATSCIAPSPLTTVMATTAPSGTLRSGLTWSLIAPASPTKTSWPPEISVRKVKLTSATGVTSAERAAIAWGTKPAAPARANNKTSSFTSVSFVVARNRLSGTTIGSRAGRLQDLGQEVTGASGDSYPGVPRSDGGVHGVGIGELPHNPRGRPLWPPFCTRNFRKLLPPCCRHQP